jgi:DEAD/DEAH box helicase domain-containing protein
MIASIESIIESFKRFSWYQENIERVIKIPKRKATYKELNLKLLSQFENYFPILKIKNLYAHQALAIEKILDKKNIIITTSTASGKTFAFLLPILNELEKNLKATALLIYPLKALTNDQYNLIEKIKEISNINLNASVYDGDTPQSKRAFIRKNARIILTNPYELHQTISYHYKWSKFFKNLKFVVIDETHRYRGIFGSNVALLIRRLRRIFEFYGSIPIFILSSASMSNPLDFAQKLTNLKFELISEDGSPQGGKFLIFWNTTKCNLSSFLQTRDIFLNLINRKLQTLCFVKSRKASELISSWAKEKIKEDKIFSYRAGYLPEKRREIENDLKNGKIQGVVSTNALELGIDIGSLDAIIISGFPNSISSFWQQMGRASRKAQSSLIIFIGLADALEQYILKNPKTILNRNFEKVFVSPQNKYLALKHILCASSELPIKEKERNIWGFELKEFISELEKENLIFKSEKGYVFIGGGRPQAVVSLESLSEESIEIISDGKVIETMDINRAYREAYKGAVILNQGRTFLIEELDLKNKKAWAKEKQLDYYTEPLKRENIKIKSIFKSKKLKNNEISFYFGLLNVVENYFAYRIKKFDRVISYNEINLPPLEFESHGIWFTLPSDIIEGCKRKGFDFAGGLHGLEHLMIALAPIKGSCDRNDLGGISDPFNEKTNSPTIFIYESYPQGVGIVDLLFSDFKEFLGICFQHIKKCSCENGCPSCILSPKCGNNNQPMDKKASIFILEKILKLYK